MKRRSETSSPPGAGAVLGIDPGSRITGWGIVAGPSARPRLVASGVIRLPPSLSFAARLHRLQQELAKVVERYAPVSAGVEAPFHGASARAALQLAHARGVALAVLAGAAVDVHEYSPATVKKSVTGRGRAEKDQVRHMVVRSLRREKDDTKQVREGFECGVLIKNFDAFEVGDVIETFKMVAVKRLLKI